MTDHTDVIWEEPPTTTPGGNPWGDGKYASTFATLRENSGRWARLPRTFTRHSARRIAHMIKKGEYLGCVPGEFDATTRSTSSSTAYVYVRHVGGGAL